MSRSGYTEGDCSDTEDFLRMCGWNANVRRCIAGRAGQAFMWELYLALEALPVRRLIQHALEADGSYCSLGAVARYRGMEIPAELRGSVEEEEEYELEEKYAAMGGLFGIKDMLAREVMWRNDDDDDVHYAEGPPKATRHYPNGPWCKHGEPRREETPEERWQRIRSWVVSKLRNIP